MPQPSTASFHRLPSDSTEDVPLVEGESVERKLWTVDEAASEWNDTRPRTSGTLSRLGLGGIIAVLALLNIALAASMVFGKHSERMPYTPAQEVLRYEWKIFQQEFGGENPQTTIYGKPPSPEVDKKWLDLYRYGLSKIPKDQALLLPNSTVAIPGDESNYVVVLDVFHQLHCLNMIRQAITPQHYPKMDFTSQGSLNHVSHCIDSIRQSLMCSGSLSPLVYQWDEEKKQVLFNGNVPHKCMDFDKILNWSIENYLGIEVDFSMIHSAADVHRSW